jgi:Lhr-like helicase
MDDFITYVETYFANKGATLLPWQRKMLEAVARGDDLILIPPCRGA